MTAHQPSKRQRAARAVVAATLGKRLPRVSGSLRVEGLRTGITIRRDDHGVPYIEAQNDDDAWFGVTPSARKSSVHTAFPVAASRHTSSARLFV